MSRKRSFQFGLRDLLLCTAVVACILSVLASFDRYFLAREREHRRLHQKVKSCIEILKRKRPPQLDRSQWGYVIERTSTANSNCLVLREYITDYPRFRRFVSQLVEEVEGDVSVDTIDWMWDEIEQLSVYGSDYSESWRPTRPDVLKPVRNRQE